jgi:hypothetical protein
MLQRESVHFAQCHRFYQSIVLEFSGKRPISLFIPYHFQNYAPAAEIQR